MPTTATHHPQCTTAAWLKQIEMLPVRRSGPASCPHNTTVKKSRAAISNRMASDESASAEVQVMNAVHDTPGTTASAIAAALGRPYKGVSEVVRILIDAGLLRCDAAQGSAKPLYLEDV